MIRICTALVDSGDVFIKWKASKETLHINTEFHAFRDSDSIRCPKAASWHILLSTQACNDCMHPFIILSWSWLNTCNVPVRIPGSGIRGWTNKLDSYLFCGTYMMRLSLWKRSESALRFNEKVKWIHKEVRSLVGIFRRGPYISDKCAVEGVLSG